MINKPPLGSQINKNHPISQGIRGCWLFNDGGGVYIRDLANNMHGTISGGVWQNSNFGQSVYQDGTDEINLAINPKLEITPAISICALVRYASVSGEQELVSRWHEPVASGTENYALQKSTSNKFVGYVYSGGNKTATSTTTVAVNTDYFVVFTYDGTAKMYVNGILEHTGDTGGAMQNYSNQTTQLGYLKYNNSHFYTTLGNIGLIYLYDRALSAKEVQDLYINPYCFISKPNLIRKIGSAVTAVINKTNFFHGW